MLWIIVGAALVALAIGVLVGGRQEADFRRRTGIVRKPRRHPGEGYVPPPFFGG